jgi:hypothetical protein
MTRLFAAVALMPVMAMAQTLPLADQLPSWAAKPWAAAAAASELELFGGINPYFQRGDFDGDGNPDLAILVRGKSSGKVGILFLHRGARPVLIGAGRPFGNGGDDFAWMDLWSVEDRSTKERERAPSAARIEALVVAREGSASARIAWRNGKYSWQQLGD